jgi:hypothetical protein
LCSKIDVYCASINFVTWFVFIWEFDCKIACERWLAVANLEHNSFGLISAAHGYTLMLMNISALRLHYQPNWQGSWIVPFHVFMLLTLFLLVLRCICFRTLHETSV